MKTIFYKKVGRRYKPVSEYDDELMSSFSKGTHIVMSYPGGKSTRYSIDPAFAPMIAAGRYAENAICSAIHQASEAKPSRTPLTKRQKAAWEEMKAAFGDELFGLEFGSIYSYAEAGVKAMQEEADKMLKNPAVRKAYERFLIVAELAKENLND
jgi:hypothetical protein